MTEILKRLLPLPLDLLKAPFAIALDKRLLLPCLVPYGIGVLGFSLCAYLSLTYRAELTTWLFDPQWNWVKSILPWLVFAASMLLSSLAALLLMLVAGAVFIEMFVEELLKREGLLSREFDPGLSVLRSMLRGIWESLLRLFYFGIFTILVMVCGFFPILFFLPPLYASYVLGFDLIDLPLTLMQRPFRERMQIAFGHIVDLLALGAMFAIFLLIPFGAVLFLPPMYFVAVRLLCRWQLSVEPSRHGTQTCSGG